jgi:hypothetical protein
VRQLGAARSRLGQSRGISVSCLHAGWPVVSVSECAECPLKGHPIMLPLVVDGSSVAKLRARSGP